MTSTEASARATGTIERAVNVPREATAIKGKVQTRGVALALWVLRGRYPDQWLVAFWEPAGSDHEIGRSQGLHATYMIGEPEYATSKSVRSTIGMANFNPFATLN